VIIAEDGSVIDLVKGRASITGNVPAGLVFVDGTTVGGVTEHSLKVRRNMAEEGVVTIVAIVNPDTGKMVEKPDFLAHGFEQDALTFDTVVPVIQKVLTKASKEGIDIEQTEELIRDAVATWARRKYRRSPLIIPVIIDA
jgi:ribonuclease J